MRRTCIAAGLTIACLGAATHLWSQDAPDGAAPQIPQPLAEHEWLERFVGEWEFTTELHMAPDQPPLTMTGTETVRSLGGFWIIAESESEAMGSTMTHVMTLGYDPDRDTYVATSVDSMSSHMARYEGEVDDDGRLVLRWRAPCPRHGGRVAEFRSVTEFDGDDRRVLTASSREGDGEWETTIVIEARRVN